MKSIRMIDSLTLAWRLFTFSTRSPIARAAAGCTEEKQQAVWTPQHLRVFEDEKQR